MGDIDGEGIKRGNCSRCACYRYFRRENSICCTCGHTGKQHSEQILLCSGETNGERCDCKKYTTSVTGECNECGHAIIFHVGGHDDRNPTAVIGSGAGVGGVEIREALRSMVNERRSLDHERGAEVQDGRNARGGLGYGGRRPGAGRKSKVSETPEKVVDVTPVKHEVGKVPMTRVGLSMFVKVSGPFTISKLKLECRITFAGVLEQIGGDCRLDTEMDKIYRKMSGLEIEDGSEKFISSTCYYYNPAFMFVEFPFDAIPKIGAKRKSAATSAQFDNDEDEDHQTGSCCMSKRSTFYQCDDNEEAREEPNTNFMDSILDEEEWSCAVTYLNGQVTTGTVDKVEVNDEIGWKAIYNISDELSSLLSKFYMGDNVQVQKWLDNVCFDGTDKEQYLLSLFNYFAFNVSHSDMDDDVAEQITIRLNRLYDEAVVGDNLREQLREQWKMNANSFNKTATVRFSGEAAVGTGPRDSYIEILRNHLFLYVMEGTDDHKIAKDDVDLYMQDMFLFAGRLMGHVARHGKYIVAGLSEVMRAAIRMGGQSLGPGALPVALEDIPSYEMQVLLRKVMDDQESLSEEERTLLSNAIEECGLQNSIAVRFDLSTGRFSIVSNAAKNNYHSTASYLVTAIAQYYVVNKRSSQIWQLVRGFDEVTKFSEFLRICGAGGTQAACNSLMEPLLHFFFPKVADALITKEQLLTMLQVDDGGYGSDMREKLRQSLETVVSRLDDTNPKSDNAVARFLQLCTASMTVPLTTKISWRIYNDPDGKPGDCFFHVCTKAVDVNSAWFVEQDKEGEFVTYLLSCVKLGAEGYAKS